LHFVLGAEWKRANGTATFITASALSDERLYRFVSDILFELCQKAEVLPCIFDAAIFAWGESEQAKLLRQRHKKATK
jgi:hypothetical protein